MNQITPGLRAHHCGTYWLTIQRAAQILSATGKFTMAEATALLIENVLQAEEQTRASGCVTVSESWAAMVVAEPGLAGGPTQNDSKREGEGMKAADTLSRSVSAYTTTDRGGSR